MQDVNDDGDWVTFRTNVSTANALLDTDFSWYRNEETGRNFLRTLEYSLPHDVFGHVNLVQPTTRFGNMKAMRSNSHEVDPLQNLGNVPSPNELLTTTAGGSVPLACNNSITPTCLLKLYNVHYGADAKNGNKVAFASFLQEYARYADLAAWEPKFAPWAVGQNFTVTTFNGGLDDQNSPEDSGEANLDCQYIKGVSAPVPESEYSTGGLAPLVPDLDTPTQAEDQNEPYLDYLMGLQKVPNSQLPQTISHSYGEDEQSVPESYVKQVCQMFGELGARGVSVIFSSGDMGVGTACLSNDGKNKTEFQPQFPAACPYVTSVGGVTHIEPEQATFFSSGGFSRVFQRPAYQAAAVEGYLAQIGNNFAQYFNRNGRGFPDVAAQSVNFAVQDKGSLKYYEGTSCAAPTFAGVVALLNSARVSSHIPPLGFLNPWIYGGAFVGLNDITHGKSTGCNGKSRFNGAPEASPIIPGASFNATPGWDPVTGFGTPDFGKLLALAAPGVPNTGGPVPA